MNYLQEIVTFTEWKEVNQLPTTAISLWYELMAVCNKCGWQREFSVPNGLLQIKAGLSKKQFELAREILIQKGRIKYRKGNNPNEAGSYTLIPLASDRAQKEARTEIQEQMQKGAQKGTPKGMQEGMQKGTQEGTQKEIQNSEGAPDGIPPGTREGTQKEHQRGNARGTLFKLKDKQNLNKEKDNTPIIPYAEIVDLYNQSCPSLPRVRELTDQRKRTIKSRWQAKGDLSLFETLFAKAEKSDFLSGRDGKWTNCSFDWLLKEANMVKVLEGNYDNKASPNAKQSSLPDELPEAWRF